MTKNKPMYCAIIHSSIFITIGIVIEYGVGIPNAILTMYAGLGAWGLGGFVAGRLTGLKRITRKDEMELIASYNRLFHQFGMVLEELNELKEKAKEREHKEH